jgi:hypothetical protein
MVTNINFLALTHDPTARLLRIRPQPLPTHPLGPTRTPIPHASPPWRGESRAPSSSVTSPRFDSRTLLHPPVSNPTCVRRWNPSIAAGKRRRRRPNPAGLSRRHSRAARACAPHERRGRRGQASAAHGPARPAARPSAGAGSSGHERGQPSSSASHGRGGCRGRARRRRGRRKSRGCRRVGLLLGPVTSAHSLPAVGGRHRPGGPAHPLRLHLIGRGARRAPPWPAAELDAHTAACSASACPAPTSSSPKKIDQDLLYLSHPFFFFIHPWERPSWLLPGSSSRSRGRPGQHRG